MKSCQSNEVHQKCTGFFYVHYTTQGTNGFIPHPKDEAIMVKFLATGHTCHYWDSNPHSADQKHRSSSRVILTTRPRYATTSHTSTDPNFSNTHIAWSIDPIHLTSSSEQSSGKCAFYAARHLRTKI